MLTILCMPKVNFISDIIWMRICTKNLDHFTNEIHIFFYFSNVLTFLLSDDACGSEIGGDGEAPAPVWRRSSTSSRNSTGSPKKQTIHIFQKLTFLLISSSKSYTKWIEREHMPIKWLKIDLYVFAFFT